MRRLLFCISLGFITADVGGLDMYDMHVPMHMYISMTYNVWYRFEPNYGDGKRVLRWYQEISGTAMNLLHLVRATGGPRISKNTLL